MSFSGSWRAFKNRERSRPPKKSAGRKKSVPVYTPIADQDSNAVVSRVFSDGVMSYLDETSEEVQCSYKRSWLKALLAQPVPLKDRTPVSAGDRVRVEGIGVQRTLTGRTDRGKRLSRYAPGKDGHSAHVMACNIDQVLLVTSAKEPDFNSVFVDRVLAACLSEGLEILLCINKMDLHSAFNNELPEWNFYQNSALKVFEVSVLTGQGLVELKEAVWKKKTAVVGLSGAGKTSLLRKLLGESIGRVGAVSSSTQKGKHTTTTSQLYLIDRKRDAFAIDTPGVREFDPVVALEDLGNYFTEFRDLPCTQNGCKHIEGVVCDAERLVRYPSYRKIYLSLRRIQNENAT